jgi:hypothetical protein
MKKLISLSLAVISTVLLVSGATHAAEKFDSLAATSTPSNSDLNTTAPGAPCIVGDEPPYSA